MEKRRDIINKILIAMAVVCVFCPMLYYKAIMAATIAIIAILVVQHKLDEKYPYDMAAYVYHLSRNDSKSALAELEGFARECPHYVPGKCLCDKVCPDCEHGRH